MSEYDLVCDACGKALRAPEAVVSWTADGPVERAFAISHPACVSPEANTTVEAGRLVWPNEYLAFVTERFGRTITEPEPLRAIAWALAPFVMRHDNPTEMDSMRAASFGQRLGVKPEKKEQEAGK
ncbi:hypothetical protein BH18CHL2_BH18CHL2_07410 [soil metagenome]